MNPVVVVLVPLGLLTGGIATFFLVPLPVGLRTGILLADILAAGLIGLLLWRRSQ